MVRGIPNITVPAIGYPMAQREKMSLPVEPSSLIYSHFEHVSGIPAPKGTQGVTITKLNLLDVLIGQLNQVKKGSLSRDEALSSGGQLNASQFDTLLENYVNQIREARSASSGLPYKNNSGIFPGALFSLVT